MQATFRHIPFCLIIIALSLVSCEESGQENRLEEELFKEYAGTKPQELSRWRPSFLAEYGRHGHTLNGLDWEAKKQEVALLKEQVALLRAQAPDTDSLNQIHREAELWIMERKIEAEPFFLYENPINPLTGFHTQLLRAFHMQYIVEKEDAEAYNARMKAIPRQIQEVISVLKARHEAGILSPLALLSASKEEIELFLGAEINQNPLYMGLAIKLNQIDPTKLNLYQASDYLEVAEQNLESYVKPAYKKLIPIIDELIAESKKEAIEGPEKGAYYAHKLYLHCGKQIDPASAFVKGMEALDSLKNLINPLLDQLSEAPKQAVATVPRKSNRMEQVQLFSIEMRKIRGQMIGLFDSLPQRSPEIMALPDYLNSEALLTYEPTSLDKTREARIVVDFDRWDSSSAYQKQAALCTQVYPGLHTLSQLSPQRASYMAPDGFTAWHRGWENYALRLADEPVYLFASSPELKLDYLLGQLHLVAAAILDLGIHHKSWSHDQAKDFIQQQAPGLWKNRESLWVEIHSNPGAQVAPWIGVEEFHRLANYTRESFSGRINVKGFHKICIENGPLPWFLFKRSIGVYDNSSLAR